MGFLKAETALIRAKELRNNGKLKHAAKTLTNVLSNRRRPWTTATEEVAMLYLDVCLDLKHSLLAKNGLHQYRTLCHHQPASLEKVIEYFLSTSKARLEKAWRESRGLPEDAEIDPSAETVDVDDLEEAESPETLLLASVSAAGAQDRTDRVMLAPFMRYRWEAFKTSMDLLKNNAKLESAYHAIAERAFSFCVKFNRRHEFRRYCDMLRLHINQAKAKKSHFITIDLNEQSTFELQLKTRLSMVRAAFKLELWQESFKGMDDINTFIKDSSITPSAKYLGAYYHRLAKVYWKSQDFILHAVAWQKLYQLILEDPASFKQDEIKRTANSCLLSTLAVPLARRDSSLKDVDAYPMPQYAESRARRLSAIANISTLPTRADLIDTMKTMNVMLFVDPALKDLYNVLETEFSPLQLTKKVEPLFAFLKDQSFYGQYMQCFHYVVIMRLLKQLSQIYTTLSFEKLLKWIPFCSQAEIEKHIINAVKNKVLFVRLCHRTKSISFSPPATLSAPTNTGPQVDMLVSSMRQSQLATIAHRLEKANAMADPAPAGRERFALYKATLTDVDRQVNKEIARYRARPRHNEKRTQRLEKEKEDADFAKQEAEEEEQARVAKELEEQREKARIEREQKEREAEALRLNLLKVQERVKTYVERNELGAELFGAMTEDDLSKLNPEDIDSMFIKEVEKRERKKREMLESMEYEKDAWERAKRTKAIPILHELFAQEREDRIKRQKAAHERKVGALRARHARALELRASFASARDAKAKFVSDVMARRTQIYEEANASFQKRLSQYKSFEAAQKAKEKRKEREENERASLIQKKKDERDRILQEKKREEEAARDAELLKRKGNDVTQSTPGPSSSSGGGKYLPPGSRDRQGGSNNSYVPPSQRGGSNNSYVPPSQRGGNNSAYVPPSQRGGGNNTAYVPPSRRGPPPSNSGSEQSRDSAPPSTSTPRSGGGKTGSYVPPHLRNRR